MIDYSKPTAQMLGRWQPFHDGHLALFKEILKKTGQVVIMVRSMPQTDNNPFVFEVMGDGSHRLVDNDTPAERKLAQRIYKRARQIEEKEWKELWKIVDGDLRGWWD